MMPTGAARALLARRGHLPADEEKAAAPRGKGATALVLARPVRGCRGGERAVLGAGLEDPEGRIYGGVVPCIFVVRVRQVVTVWRPIRGRLAVLFRPRLKRPALNTRMARRRGSRARTRAPTASATPSAG